MGLCSVAILTASPLAFAQTRQDTTTGTTYREDRNFDLGWLGLLGLVGLMGLKRREPDYHRTETQTRTA